MNNKVHHFGAIGLTDGLAVLADRETRTHWNHITGKATDGPLAGCQLEVFPVHMTTVAAALAEQPDLTVTLSTHRSLRRKLAQALYPYFIHRRVWFPGFLYASMNAPVDARLDRLTQGLGVIVGKRAKFYPMQNIPAGGFDDYWGAHALYIARHSIDGVPFAKWKDTSEEPMQLLTRWYGFSFTYPECEIYGPK